MVKALASQLCGPGPNPGVDAICGLSLLLVLSFTLRGFFPVHLVFPSPQAPTLPNFNSFWNEQTRLNEFLRTPKSFVGKQITPTHPSPFRRQRHIRIFSVFDHYFSPQVKSTQIFIRDSSMVHPVALILLSGKDVKQIRHEIRHGMYHITELHVMPTVLLVCGFPQQTRSFLLK